MKFVGVEERRVRRENPSRPPLLPLRGLFHRRGDSRGAPWITTEADTSKFLGVLVPSGTTVAMAACCMIPSASGWPALCHL